MNDIELWQGDCLQLMKDIPDNSVDLIITDPPYGTTKNKWDTVIDLEEMWKELKRITRDKGCILLFSSGMFSSKLKISNEKMWRYDLVWDKVLKSGFLNSNKMPLRKHEIISIFYKKLPVYNPQKYLGNKNNSKGVNKKNKNNNYGDYNFVDNSKNSYLKYPDSILSFEKTHPSKSIHPTQKPVSLMEYLIRTYTHEGYTVLDFTMGSGTTGVACKNLGRKFIGIELDEGYFNIAKNRINETKRDDE